MKLFTLAITTAAVVLSACATSPTPLTAAKDVPASRIYVSQPSDSAPAAKAIFVRDKGFLGSGVYQHIFVNGEKAASLDTGEKVELTLPPGEYILGVKPTDAFGTTALYSIDQILTAGKTYYYRILIDGNSFLSRLQRFMPDQPNPQ